MTTAFLGGGGIDIQKDVGGGRGSQFNHVEKEKKEKKKRLITG